MAVISIRLCSVYGILEVCTCWALEYSLGKVLGSPLLSSSGASLTVMVTMSRSVHWKLATLETTKEIPTSEEMRRTSPS